jgi:uncharacterized membrane protein
VRQPFFITFESLTIPEMKIRKQSLFLILTVAGFGIIYALISLVNHYNFRTFALDLGLYTNALYKYAHFHWADSIMMKENYELLLGGHFDLYLVIFSPLVYIFGTYTLLNIQIAAILAGGLGVYRYFETGNTSLHVETQNIASQQYDQSLGPIFAMIFYFAFYGIYSALSYDYHSNVVAASLVPWFFYFIKKAKYGFAALFCGLILISQENVALWMVFICLGLLIEYRKNKKAVIYLSAFSVISIFYFLAVINFIIPAFSNSSEYTGFTYSILGNTPGEALKTLVMHPIDSLGAMFVNHNNSLNADYIKIEMLLMVLMSGMYFLFLKPAYLVMLIPVFFQKLFHDKSLVWGIDGQYSIEFAPILAIGVFSVISEFKTGKAGKILTAIALLGVLLSTFRVMDNTVMYTQKSRIRFYQANHYKRNYDVKSVHRQLAQIPRDAAVSAMTMFVPHLSLRDKIYQFPLINDAEYIVYSEKEAKYPLDEAGFNNVLARIKESGNWILDYEGDGVVVLKKSEDRSQKTE